MARNYRYRPLGDDNEESGEHAFVKHIRGRRARRSAIAMGVAFIVLLGFLFAYTWGSFPQLPFTQSCHGGPAGYQCRPEISHHWGQYSPFFSVPSEIAADIPKGCEVTFAQVLSRHGSRDPTFGKSVSYAALIERLKRDVTSFAAGYAFLEEFEYRLGANELTVFGMGEMYRSGQSFYRRYRSLANTTVPFVRASGQSRVMKSANNFTQGMRQAAMDDSAESADSYPVAVTILSEAKGSNNTLNNGLCDALEEGPAASTGEAARREHASLFIPTVQDRLNAGMPGANLTLLDAISLMDMCPFDTVASPTGVVSPFCDLFSEEEWIHYNYYQTLGKFYGHGPGNPFGPTQGVGFVNELVARLTGKPVEDHTSVNHTIDDDPRTFPIGEDNTIFADFSHDNDMTAVLGALGIYDSTQMLSNTTIVNATEADGYSAAWTVPFSARIYFEKMQCTGTSQEYVRVLINDRVSPLEQCGSDALGRCTLGDFVQSLSWAQSGGRWDECFATYLSSTTTP